MNPNETARTRSRPKSGRGRGARAAGGATIGRLVAPAAALLVSAVLFAPPALAHHFTGEVQLWPSSIGFRDAPGGVAVSVLLIERESGESVSGFGVRVAATGGGGTTVGPVELAESEFAVYSGTLPLGPGAWEIRVTTHQGPSSLPAIESAHRKTLEVDATGRLVASAEGGSGVATVLAIVLPIGAVFVLLLVARRRRRSGGDDEADADGDPDSGGGGPEEAVPAPDGSPSGDRRGR